MSTLVGLDLRGRLVVVAGGGPAAARRARALVDDGARLRVVAPALCEDMTDVLTGAPDATWRVGSAEAADLDGAWFVVAATGDDVEDRHVTAWAESARVWCLAGAGPGSPGRGARRAGAASAVAPATTRSGRVQVAVLADDEDHAGAVRDRLAEQLREGRVDLRRPRPDEPSGAHRTATRRGPAAGSVTLVGGGPGATDLLTLRGRRALATADVVVTDRLGPVGVLGELPASVEIIDVGKTPGHHPVPQHEINAILVEQAQRGRTVVRLKGGDPFVYGRGGEEVLACRAAGVAVEVVPGVSSALSVPALAGIPLTHRGTVGAFHVVNGHDGLDVGALAAVRDRTATLVILMGVSMLSEITDQAVAAGADVGTPVAVVESGSTEHQRVTRATLGTLVERAAQVGVRAPAVVVVGDVAAEGLLAPALVPERAP
ncbi:uroporphyrinogen-III C-methyltransferase [Oerskovia merdavium]|uniref:uroporphyrinogen-III C-methyltransferase n=1 Tax=Oerskovia merdavium TaxID=2762227 RepID=A0ABR8U2H8_9CELL|nr:uroporphyrinogen-III C-methyltransferase [Oerskovia merdavium]MBD7981994.1 uroporphyrinogen-III C-methyltransferase [Oerskovia merdavium]